MIQVRTNLNVADNSGAKTVTCIKVLGGSNHMIARLSDVIVVSVQEVSGKDSKVKKGGIHRAVIVRSKFGLNRTDGTKIAFNDNAVVLVNNQNEPIGSRILGAVAREIKSNNFSKIASLAQEVL